MNELLITYGAIFWLFVIVVAVLWALLPLAVFGIKGRLDDGLLQARAMNKHLTELNAQLREIRKKLEDEQ